MSIRVLVVDDSSFMRRLLSKAVESAAGVELVGVARDGVEAVEMVGSLDPDVVTLDIEMPRKNGLDVLRSIKKGSSKRPAVVMCSSLTTEGSDATLEALRLGAADFIAKDSSFSVKDGDSFQREVLAKIRAVGPRSVSARKNAAAPKVEAPSFPRPSSVKVPRDTRVVVVGSSTGGPPVLDALVRSLPDDFALPVVIAQHMPELFTKSLTKRLDSLTSLSVRLAGPGLLLEPGTVTVGLGGSHVVVSSRGGVDRVSIESEPENALYKPDVDELFASAAEHFGPRAVGIMLTGMGDDGADGAGRIRERGGVVLAQDEETSVVYGMPRAVAERGHANGVGSPPELFAFLRALSGAATRSARRSA
ncbi:MAG: chemotaxis-specific protein-glutamate methyltransferase CheB [Planctomycetota bacterium]